MPTHDRAAKEKRFWDAFAGKYDAFIRLTLGKTYQEMIRQLSTDLKAGDEVLEIATGTGLLAFAVCEQVCTIRATDISGQMIVVARRNLESSGCRNITFEVQDAYHLSYPDGSFDVVLAANVLHLLIDPALVLAEMKRVLRPAGRLILPTFCHGENWKAHLISRLMGLGGFEARHRWSVEELKDFLKRQDWRVEKAKTIKDAIPLLYLVLTP